MVTGYQEKINVIKSTRQGRRLIKLFLDNKNIPEKKTYISSFMLGNPANSIKLINELLKEGVLEVKLTENSKPGYNFNKEFYSFLRKWGEKSGTRN